MLRSRHNHHHFQQDQHCGRNGLTTNISSPTCTPLTTQVPNSPIKQSCSGGLTPPNPTTPTTPTTPTAPTINIPPLTPKPTPTPTKPPTLTTNPTPTKPPTLTTSPKPKPVTPTPGAITASPIPTSAGPSYYVSTTGSDQNAGTLDRPFATLQAAIGKITNGGGGNIYLRGGTYNLAATAWIGDNNDGSANSQLVIRPYQSEKVVLDGQNRDIVGVSVGGQYVNVVGLEIKNTKMGVIGWGAQNLSILNNTIHDTNDTGIASYAPQIFGAANVRVEGNTVYRTNQKNNMRGDTGNWGSGITMSRTQGAVVSNNLVYENFGEGVTSTLSNNVRIANNIIHDNYSVELYLDNATNSVVENNFVYNTGNRTYFRNSGGIPQPASGIRLANETYETVNSLNNNIIRNNIVSGTLIGLEYANYGVATGMRNSQIVNNTFYGGTEATFRISGGTHQNTTIANNIFVQPTAGRALVDTPGNLSGITFSHNLWSGGAAGRAASSTDVNANPMLVNPGGFQAVDYKLKSGSAAANKGAVRSDVTIDYFGTRRPTSNVDIGAHELV